MTIAAPTAQGRTLGLELNIKIALNNGATRQEVAETLLHIAPYAGFAACWKSLELARPIFDEMDMSE